MIPRVLWILFALVHVYVSNSFVVPHKSRIKPVSLPTMHHDCLNEVVATRNNRLLTTTTTTTTTTTLASLGGEESSILLVADYLSFLSNINVWIFLAGLVPFGWATIEFWRRIAVGEPFGTSSNTSVYIGKDYAPKDSRGRRVLDRGAFAVAYVLFGIAATTIGIALYSVLTSPLPPMMDTVIVQ
jgi:hypothetical protein